MDEVKKQSKSAPDPKSPAYVDQNADWHGRVINFKEETDIFPQDSYIRIWRNVQTIGFLPHWHDAIEIIIPVENDYEVEVEGTTYHLLPDHILFIPAGATHSIKASESGIRHILLFGIGSLSRIRGYSSLNSMLGKAVLLTPKGTPAIHERVLALMNEIVDDYFFATEYYEFSIYSNLFEALVLIARYRLGAAGIIAGSDPVRKKHFQRFQSCIDYIDHHYTEPITLDSAADFCGFSKYHFSRLFKEYADSNFYDYLILRRIKAAEMLLSDPSLSITEVGLQSGFSSISTFNRSFKKLKGCTPGEYRALYSLNGVRGVRGKGRRE
ncbi:MAG: AraC family transcriptional regulator [Lachnospiraceae bacterium]|nr:AraC family transcriptional regulator [Lachnospiraceae bacterium]